MKPPFIIAATLLLATLAQGQLSPPSSPAPPPTLTPPDSPGALLTQMRTLLQIEPRTPINNITTQGDTSCIFKISKPGSYYLTGNILGEAAKNGILIDAANVTIDLGGFALEGIVGSGDGIVGSSKAERATVKNGKIFGWGRYGLFLKSGSRAEDVIALQNSSTGITATQTHRCTVIRNGGDGLVSDLAEHCEASDNDEDGIVTNRAEYCRSFGNGENGIATPSDHLNEILTGIAENCRTSGNYRAGIVMERVINCESQGNNFGVVADYVTGCIASENTTTGIVAYSFVDSCLCSSNSYGISVSGDGCVITNNLCRKNENHAFDLHISNSRVESNHAANNGFGISVDGAKNIIVRNTSISNSNEFSHLNYIIDPGNFLGIILKLTPSGGFTTDDSGPSGLGLGIGNIPLSSPGANFSN